MALEIKQRKPKDLPECIDAKMVTSFGMTYTVTVFQESERNAEKILRGTLLWKVRYFT